MRGRVFCAHEADAGQRAGWSGEGEGAVKVAGPDGVAEWSAGPQAAGAAKDRLVNKTHNMGVRLETGRQMGQG